MNANTIKDGDEEAWTRMLLRSGDNRPYGLFQLTLTMLPGNCDISSVKAYRQKILTAKPDLERTETYKLFAISVSVKSFPTEIKS